jgi:hypothetical protein
MSKSIIILTVILGALTAAHDATSINTAIRRFTLSDQWATEAILHCKLIHGVAVAHWQYRVLPEYVIELFSPVVHVQMGEEKWDAHYSEITPIVLKVVTNVLLFVLLALYLSKLGLTSDKVLMGLFAATFVHTGVFGGNFMHASYLDICFYLGFSLLVLYNKSPLWSLLLMFPAALNKETAVFIPLIMASMVFYKHGKWRDYLIPLATLAVFMAIFFLLRMANPQQSPDYFKDVSMLNFNLTDIFSLSLFLPFVVVGTWCYLQMRKTLHPYLTALVPPCILWIGVNLYGGYIRDIRTSEVIIYL